MSYTLIMRLAGPMQSWGISSRFGIRETLSEPSKSGVIGLLCAALGWDRAAPTHIIAGQSRSLADLASLPFGVRVVQEGVVRRDYHTAQNVLRAKAKLKPGRPANPGDLQNTVLSERYYLSDAYFLVGLESEDEAFLRALDAALGNPHWPLSLGRKAFIPSYPVQYMPVDQEDGPTPGVVNHPLIEALLLAQDSSWQQSAKAKRVGPGNSPTDVPIMPTTRYISDKPVDALANVEGLRLTQVRQVQRTDVPLSFDPRRFAPREVTIYTVSTHVSLQTTS